jgi:orotate phosphoribosyltransferase
MPDKLLNLLATRKGHFRLESGHHGDLWLDLELLCLRPERIQRLAVELVKRLKRIDVEVVCGPLIEGAFVALMVASQMGVEFTYTERFASQKTDALFPVQYRLPGALRGKVRGKRVAIVNDVINAGSAVRGTFADLVDCGAQPVVVAALLVLGTSASSFAAEQGIFLESLVARPNSVWLPKECPLCSDGVPLDDPCPIGL